MKKNKKSKISLIAGISGAVVGIGAAIAGAVALKKPENQAKVKKVLNKVKTEARKDINKIKRKIAKTKRAK